MENENTPTFTAFAGGQKIAAGQLSHMLRGAKAWLERQERAAMLIFEDQTGKQVDFDFRGSADEVVERASAPDRPGPGRPKLGVVSKEVTLLPRHWEWLEAQSGGISAALRRLVEEAKKRDPGAEDARLAREAANRFMTAIAGDLPQYEEATRALFAKERWRFEELIRPWPDDVRAHVWKLAKPSFAKK